MTEEAVSTGPVPDPLATLTREPELKVRDVLASPRGEYEQGVLAGSALAIDLVEREHARLREIYEEHVPGRVSGPLGEP